MAFPVEVLKSGLDKGLRPVYLVYGEEPQQMTEAIDLIRATAANKGFLERITLFADSRFDWAELRSALEVSPLFSDKTVVDLRLSGSQPNKAGSTILEEYLSQPSLDIVLLLSAEKLSKSVAKSAWFKLVRSSGVVQQFKPLLGRQLLDWLTQRAKQKGLNIERDSINLMAARVEGNLLAAAQEIDKLYLDFGNNKMTSAEIEQWVTDQSRYDVFAWVESTLEGKLSRCQRILHRMQLEGVAPALVVWGIARELRLLLKLSEHGHKPDIAIIEKAGVWGKRKQSIQKALLRMDRATLLQAHGYCCYIDRVLKGVDQGDVWQCIGELCAMIALAPKKLLFVGLRDELSIQLS